MAIPTVYKWTDAGAPQINAGRYNEGGITKAYDVLQAVLVDGYGSQTAAGWTMPFRDDTALGGEKVVFKQGGTGSVKSCLRFEGDAYEMRVNVETAADYTDIDTPVTKFSPTNYFFWFGYTNSPSTTRTVPWTIIATATSAYMFFGYGQTLDTDGGASVMDERYASNPYINSMYFGDYVSNATIAPTNNKTCWAYVSGTTTHYEFGDVFTTQHHISTGHRRVLGDPATDLQVPQGIAPLFTSASGSGDDVIGYPYYDVDHALYPNASNGNLYLEKYKLLAGRTICGEMPGLLYAPATTRPFEISGNLIEIAGTGDYVGETLIGIAFKDSGQCYIRTGVDWGVE